MTDGPMSNNVKNITQCLIICHPVPSHRTPAGSLGAQGTARRARCRAAWRSRLSSNSSPLPSMPWRQLLQQQLLSSIQLCRLAMPTSMEVWGAWELSWPQRHMDKAYQRPQATRRLTLASLLQLWQDLPTLLSSRNRRTDLAMETAMGTL